MAKNAPHPRTNKSLKWLCLFVLLCIAAFGIFYVYSVMVAIIRMDFSGPDAWSKLYFVDDDVSVPISTRLSHAALLAPIVLSTAVMIGAAMLLVLQFLRGIYFQPRTAIALQVTGGAAAASSLFSHIGQAFEGWMLTQFNKDDVFPIRLRLDSGEVGLFLIGVGVFLMAWMLRIAMIKETENREMV